MREPYPLDQLLTLTADLLHQAATGEKTSRRMSDAIRLILAVTNHPDVFNAQAEQIAQIEAGFDAAFHAILDDTEGEIPHLHLAFCIGQTRLLLPLFGRPVEELQQMHGDLPLILDHLDYASLIASQLEGLDRVRKIEARGTRQVERFAMQAGLIPDLPIDVVIH
jgi:hypothetical protein